MLYIHTNNNIKNKIPLIDIEAEFNIDSPILRDMYLDEKSRYILETIEGMRSRTGDIIETKFGNTLMTNISTGCKVLLLCNTQYKERAICVDEAGTNVISLFPFISIDKDIHIISHRVLKYFPADFVCHVEDEECTGYEITLAMAELLNVEVF